MAHLSFCSSLGDTMANCPHCDCGELPRNDGRDKYREPEIPQDIAARLEAALAAEMARQSKMDGMPKTSKEKQEDYRARMALLGMKEVRGIYLPEALHPVIKEQAAKLLEKHKPEERK